MLRNALFGSLLVAALGVALPVTPAQATSLAPLTEEQMTDASTYIVQGQITDVWAEVDDNGIIWTRARVAIDTVFKGPDSPDSLVIDNLGGQLGVRRLLVPGAARYSTGEDVFLYLTEVDFGRRLTPVAMHQGKLTVRRAPGESRSHVMRWHQDNERAFDHNFLPHPAPADRLYLDDLLERVETRLDTGWDGQPIPGISPEKLLEVNSLERRTQR